MDGYELLLNAVVECAVDDYRHAKRALNNRHNLKPYTHIYYEHIIKDVEDFFRNGRVSAFTTLDGNYIMDKLEEEFNNVKT